MNLKDALKKFYQNTFQNKKAISPSSTVPDVYEDKPIVKFTKGMYEGAKEFTQPVREFGKNVGNAILAPFETNRNNQRLATALSISQKNLEAAKKARESGNSEAAKRLAASNLSRMKGESSFSKQTEDFYTQQQKSAPRNAVGTGIVALESIVGGPRILTGGGASTAALSGVLSGVIGKVQGRDFYSEAGKGVAKSIPMLAVTKYTDPLISKGANLFGNSAPLLKQIGGRLTTATGNVVEDDIIARLEGNTPDLKDRLTSAAIGAVVSPQANEEMIKKVAKVLKEKGKVGVEAFNDILSRGGKPKPPETPAGQPRDPSNGRYTKGEPPKPVEPQWTETNGGGDSLKRVDKPPFVPAGPSNTKEMMAAAPFGMGMEKDENGNLKPTYDPKRAALAFGIIAGRNVLKNVQLPKTEGELRVGGNNNATNVRSVDNPLVMGKDWQTKTATLNADGEPLPWESTKSLSLEDIQASRQVETGTPQNPEVQAPKVKAVTDQLKVSSDGSIPPAASPEVKSIEKATSKKVNLLDWMRTPDRVLKKIGLEKQATVIKQGYNNYLDQLPKEIDRVTQWYNQVKGIPNASRNIFRYLDGQDVKLAPQEQKVAEEMKGYLKDWADKLKLPEDKRIAAYITHIFDKDFVQKDFDEDLAKIITDKVPGSVYDPFLQERLGKQGYVEDAFKALDAYVKRATRKFNMDPALEQLKKGSEGLDVDSWKYVKSYADRINLRPQDIDNLLDNFIKQTPIGYKFGSRPTASITRSVRQAVYRGTLGLNVGSAIRNLTQGANTYAKLGEKYTAIGYMRAFKDLAFKSGELEANGVLRDMNIQDRQISAVKKTLEKADKGLFAFFNLAERINRGSAYFGAKAKYLSQGFSESEAVQKAVGVARDTQFTFGSVDTPVAMQGDLVKSLLQFQSFNIKQTEFLAEMVKNKEWGGMLRWTGANLVLMAGLGNLIGIDLKDIVPFSGVLTGESKIGQTPPVQLLKGVSRAITKAPDAYGNIPEGNVFQRIAGNKDVQGAATAFIPGGVQAKKTIQGIQAYKQGASTSSAGRVRYPIDPGVGSAAKSAIFGQYAGKTARDYFNQNKTPLGNKDTAYFMDEVKTGNKPSEVFSALEAKRQRDNGIDKVAEMVKASKVDLTGVDPETAAEGFYRKIMAEDKDKRMTKYQELSQHMTPEIKESLKNIKALEDKGLGSEDRSLLVLPEPVRARAVVERILALDEKNRLKKYQDLVAAGVITESMKPQIARLRKETKP